MGYQDTFSHGCDMAAGESISICMCMPKHPYQSIACVRVCVKLDNGDWKQFSLWMEKQEALHN